VQPAQLKDFFILAESLPVAGFSVTIPHKQKIVRYLDVVDPLARRIGAVNTVWKKAGKWRGANTDADAVTIPLSRKLRLSKSSVLVVGNGGAARSAAYALVGSGATVSIVGRNPDRVRSLARACGAESLLREQMNGRKFDALVHATPLGMFPHPKPVFSRTPFPPSWSSTWCTTRSKPRFCGTPFPKVPRSYRACRCFWNRPAASSRSGPAAPPRGPSWRKLL
jgi:3-dehydroquinate dehydratase/shikimate dehydrogenase